MKYLFLLLFVPLLFHSCDEESCKNSESPDKTFKCLFNVNVGYNDGSVASDVPVEVSSQKWWCDGSYDIVARYSGYTDDIGNFRKETGFSYVLNNDLDYIRVVVYVGENRVEYAYDIYYPAIYVTQAGQYIIDIYHTK